MDLDGYFERIGYGGGTDVTLRTLQALNQAHVAAIPFENVDVLLGTPLDLTVDGLQAKLICASRGGYCFEHCQLFGAVLDALGYRTTLLAARVRFDGRERPRTHALLLVELADGRYLADVGFGELGSRAPLPLREDARSEDADLAYRVQREGHLWLTQAWVEDAWLDLYSFSTEPQRPIDYVMANHYVATHPNSPFTQRLVVARVPAQERRALRDLTLTITTPEGRQSHAIEAGDLAAILLGQFRVTLPEATIRQLQHRLANASAR